MSTLPLFPEEESEKSEKSEKSLQQQLKSLRAEIKKHDQLYYNEAQPEITDAAYDALYRKLEELEQAHPELHDPESPTQGVGGTVLESFDSIEHLQPMLSIDDYFSHSEIERFFQKLQVAQGEKTVEVTIEPKIDGVAASLLYKEGKLIYCATRGDGKRGDDITANAHTIANLPRFLEKAPPLLEVRGEIFMRISDFEQLNQKRAAEGKETFANPRNTTAGTVKMLDSKEVAKRPLAFLAHGIGAYEGEPLKTENSFRQLLKQFEIPLNSPVWQATNVKEVLEAITQLDIQRHELDHATDGAVIKVNDFKLRQKMGTTSRAPRWAAAFKYPTESQATVLHDITIQVGRTGNLTPVAELKPVQISGTTVSRATLHNADEIKRKDIRIGDTVIIEKKGEIIPAVVRVVTEQRPATTQAFDLFSYVKGVCPSCAEPITREEGFVAWKCYNFSCPAQAVTKITHFASRKALDIQGLGESVAIRLVETGMARNITDLFNIDLEKLTELELDPATHKDGTQSKPRRFGKKRAQSLLNSLENAKTQQPLAKWVYALGIDHIGESAAREVARLCESLHSIADCSIFQTILALHELKEQCQQFSPRTKVNKDLPKEEKEELQKKFTLVEKEATLKEQELQEYAITPDLGKVATRSLLAFFQSETGRSVMQTLQEHGVHPTSEHYAPKTNLLQPLPLTGLTFVITGTLSKGRSDFKRQIEQLGGKVSGSISKNTNHLLCGEGGGSKKDKASKLNVNILTEEDFNALCEL